MNLCPGQKLDIYYKYSKLPINDPENIVADTCELGLQKVKTWSDLKHLYGHYYEGAREPAPAYSRDDLEILVG